ncbi:hypothetical protein [Cocleimonas flava]|uniref:Uncharacterized protein n=1 Tax=Cocleimonas flava TaxID=634765 RepID=A0A4R1F4Z9_9GAMM|nr:hypothetical protein [Cocleimonas flava]TCJ87674.1 hypothetical protein EV695_2187 [Cocleimonas flava]
MSNIKAEYKNSPLKNMRLPPSKFFLFLLFFSLCLMVLLSIIGHYYEEQIIQSIGEQQAAKMAKLIFVVIGGMFAISSMTLFIRNFPGKIIKVIRIENPELATKLSALLNPLRLDRFAFLFNVFIILGLLYIAYAIQNGTV